MSPIIIFFLLLKRTFCIRTFWEQCRKWRIKYKFMICLEGDEPPIDAVMISAKDSLSRVFFLVGFYGTQINGPLSMQQRMGQEWKTLIFFLLFPSVLIFFYFFGQKNHKSDNKKRMLMIIRALKVFSFFTFFFW